jgi:hypothetical protein
MAETTDEVTRSEVRPGLVMVKRRTRKEDGRYLIYFEFERAAASAPAREGAADDA